MDQMKLIDKFEFEFEIYQTASLFSSLHML